MNRMMRWPGLLCGLLTVVGCGGAEELPAPETQAVQSLKAERQAATSAGWTMTSPMQYQRDRGGAALLDSGLVLVAGGHARYPADDFPTNLTELYNPYTNTWQATGAMNTPRYNFATVKLASGKILVSGGWDYYYMVAGAELYDPATGAWSHAGALSSRRNNHKATLLQSGKVLVTGGEIEVRNGADVHFDPATTAELYDPETNTWSSAGVVGRSAYQSVPVLLYSGEVMLITGNQVDIYNPATNSWRYGGSTPGDRTGFTATRLYSGEVLLVGGSHSTKETFVYNPYSNQWRKGPSTNQIHRNHTATLLYSGQLLIAGGTDGSAEIYDPQTNAWIQREYIGAGCTGGTAVLLHPGNVLLTAGWETTSLASIFTP